MGERPGGAKGQQGRGEGEGWAGKEEGGGCERAEMAWLAGHSRVAFKTSGSWPIVPAALVARHTSDHLDTASFKLPHHVVGTWHVPAVAA